MITRRTYLKASAATAALGLSSFSLPSWAQGQSALTIAVPANPPQLDPLRLQTIPSFRVLFNTYDFPIRTNYRDSLQRGPGLADAWTRIDDRTLEMRFRPDVVFHNGDRMTSQDVAFSFGPERLGPDTPGAGMARQYLDTLDGVEIVDDNTVRFITKDTDPLLEYRLAGWGSQIISQRAFEEVGDWERWALAPVGTGPYRVDEVRSDEFIHLVAHDGYWNGRAPYRSLRFQVVPEAAGRVNGLLAGDYDIVTDISPDQLGTVDARDGYESIGGSVLNHRVLNFDTTEGVMRDPRIRRAVGLAIDRQLIVDTLFGGRTHVPNGFQWQAYGPMYIADFGGAEYNPDLARQLLAEAGYAGEPIRYRSHASYYTAELQTAQVLLDMWRRVGLNVELEVVESWDQIWQKPNGGIFNGSINMIYPDVSGTLWSLYGPTGFIRRLADAWYNDRFDEIGNRLLTEPDVEARLAAHREILELFEHVDPPGTVLHASAMFYGKRSDLDWTPYQLPYMDFGPASV